MSTLFISDLHLDESRPEIVDLFERFLETDARGAEALYILGDLFESWIGDDDDSPLAQRVARALRTLSDSGVPVYFMRGNRDFVLGKDFARKAGMTILDDPTIIDLNGERALLMHGDTLCIDDVSYQKFRRIMHNRWFQRIALALPLSIRRRIAGTVARAKPETCFAQSGSDHGCESVGCRKRHARAWRATADSRTHAPAGDASF